MRIERLEVRRVLSASAADWMDLDWVLAHGLSCGCPACAGVDLVSDVAVGSSGSEAEGVPPLIDPPPVIAPPDGGSGDSLPIPELQSLPGAPAFIYLDFDGHFQAQWGAYSNITTPAYDTDGNPGNFSQGEIDEIVEIWQRVSEDYAPFNINVTTVDLGDYSNGVGLRVAIGGSYTDWYGTASSGVAYIFSFINVLPNVAYVFENNLGTPRRVADIVSHEAGHTFGLFHQSLYNAEGVRIQEYYTGTPPAWSPLMGNPLFAERSTWHNGTSTSATTFQDDVAVIAGPLNGFGFRTDDHGNTPETATPLAIDGSQVSGAGIIEQLTDLDYFSFTTGAGEITLSANVFEVGPNLNARVELRSASNELIAAADPAGSLSATITTSVDAGDYYFVVASHGTYGDLGQYTVTGSIAPANGSLVADAGGPYEFYEGDDLIFDASASSIPPGADVLGFYWDLDGDGTFDDAEGPIVVIPWELVDAEEVDGPIGWGDVRVRIDTSLGEVTSPPTTFMLHNAPPTASISGPALAVRGQRLTYTFWADDPSSVDQAAGFTYQIDWNGDGLVDQLVAGLSGLVIEHEFDTLGAFTIRVTATDKDGGVSEVATLPVDVVLVGLQPDADLPGVTNLAWGGTQGNDVVEFVELGPGQVEVRTLMLGGVPTNDIQVFGGVNGRVFAFGRDGNDQLLAQGLTTIGGYLVGGLHHDTIRGGGGDDIIYGDLGPDEGDGVEGRDWIDGGGGNDLIYADGAEGSADTVFGGDGNDTIYAGGGNDWVDGGDGDDWIISPDGPEGGNDVLIGGAGNDTLQGGSGRDILLGGDGNDVLWGGSGRNVLMGGSGSDTLIGGNHDDLLIAGTTAFDSDALSLGLIQLEWSRDISYEARIDHLTGAQPGGVNGTAVLVPGVTVFDDDAVDVLLGGTGLDWFVLNLLEDLLDDLGPGEQVLHVA